MLFGDIAELIVENVLMNGAEIISRVIAKVAERLSSDDNLQNKKPDSSLVYEKCVELIDGHYLKRLPMPCNINASEESYDIQQREERELTEAFKIPYGIVQGLYRISRTCCTEVINF